MLIKLLKKHEISFTIILGFLCFIVALIFFGNEFPGKNILFYGYNNPTNLQIKNENLYLHTGNQYRLTTFVEVRGKPIHIEPILALKIEQSNNIEIDKKFYLVKGRGHRSYNHFWWFNDYGLFSPKSSGNFNISITADKLPKELDTLEIIVSEKASNWGRFFFISIGVLIFLVLLIRKGNTKVTIT